MKFIRMTVLGAATAAILGVTLPALPAVAKDTFSISVDAGNVRMGYSDGFWDSDHRWHTWSDSHQAQEFRDQHKDRYVHESHNKFQNMGWRDSDHDGVPDRLDNRPNNPNSH